MKKIIIDGRLGKDAEVGQTPRGTKYLRFSLANDSFSNGERHTEWWEVTTYDEFLVTKKVELLKKGRYVIVDGTFESQVRTNNGKVYLNQYLNANSIEIPVFGSRSEGENVVSEGTSQPAQVAQPAAPQYTAPQAPQAPVYAQPAAPQYAAPAQPAAPQAPAYAQPAGPYMAAPAQPAYAASFAQPESDDLPF